MTKNEHIEVPEDDGYVDELAPGTSLGQGQFIIEKFLNAGGFGITYLAQDNLGRRVVIKECFPSSFCNRSGSIVQPRTQGHAEELESVVESFVQEARSLAKLEHPNIVSVHQVFKDNNTAYMVLDFIEGRDLLDTLEDEDNGLTAPQIKGILKDVLGAIQYVHSQDILHRDISPDNILLDASMRPVLIDFGAAREEAAQTSRILSKLRVVKDGYSPQEFYIQGSTQTPSSDLYALGATFYHLIEGELPPNSQARLAAIATGDKDLYLPLVNRIKGFDKKLLASIDKSLEILPKNRLQSAQEWLGMLEGTRLKSRVVTPIVPVSSAAAETSISEEKNKSKLVFLLGSSAAVAILAAVAFVTTGSLEGTDGQDLNATTLPVPSPEVEAAIAAQLASDLAAEKALEEAEIARRAEISARQVAATQAAENSAAELAAARDALQIEIENLAEIARLAQIAEAEAATQREAELAEAKVAQEIEIARLAEIVATEAAQQREAELAAAILAQEARQIELAEEAAQRQIALAAEEAAQRQTALAAEQAATTSTSNITSSWFIDVPFSALNDTNVIDNIYTNAPAWAQSGTKILAIDGVPIDKVSEILPRVTISNGGADTPLEMVTITLIPEGGDQPIQRNWVLPLIQTTVLANGHQFDARFDGEAWTTVVTALPYTGSELKIGDQLVAFIPTSEFITERTSLEDILKRAMADDQEDFSFAVSRSGSMWVVAMDLSSDASN